MTNAATQWRIQLAHDLAQHYPADVILMVGSVATGQADAYSDIDLLMYWRDAVPSNNERAAIARAFNAITIDVQDTTDDANDLSLQSWGDAYRIGASELKIDIGHKTFTSMESLINDVTVNHTTMPLKLAMTHGFLEGMVIKGEVIVSEWREQLNPMPQALFDVLMNNYLNLIAFNLVEMIVRRGDALYARQLISQWCKQLLQALIVLNGHYPPMRMKQLAYLETMLEHKPSDLAQQITQIANAPIDVAIELAKVLIQATFDCIDTQNYDTTVAREQFNRTRPANHNPMTFQTLINKEKPNNA